MKIEVFDNPDKSLVDFLDEKIAEFNWQHWEVNERLPIAVQIKVDDKVIAGAAGRTFGNWLQLSTLWVSDNYRGQQLGAKILAKLELAAKDRGCKKCILDTLNFQAMPFYQKYGYEVVWTQQEYPKTGCKYFMVKAL